MAGVLTLPAGEAAAGPARGKAELGPLRDELVLEPGPSLRGGAPSWTLYDPTSNRFHRIGWLEFEILCRWHLGSCDDIAARIREETTLRPSAQDVERFAQFAARSELLRGVGVEGTQRLLQRKAAARQGWLTWLTHHYLFVRIPLMRPDRLLEKLLRHLGWVYSRGFLAVTVLAALLGLYLALRQWDSFSASFPWFFSFEGAALAGAALVASKLLHELGHGLTAKRFGCRVPSMGVALLVMAPVLYTDTSAAWRLRKRRQRLAVGGAGVAAECCLAAYALLLWNFLPDGVLRSVVFVWATTTWILTVLINLSPFMRFDGYYLFSDLIDVPNLQDRSFALARHQLRETLFGLGEPPPEVWPRRMRRLLLAYAFSTWIYRLVLFLGIAVAVYHMFFKLLGIVLFLVEIWWFVGRPVMREIGEWVRRRRGRPLNVRSLITFAGFGLAMAAFFIPWRTSIPAPALMTADSRVQLFSQLPGRVAAIRVSPGDHVRAGEHLIEFDSADAAYSSDQASRRVAGLAAQIQAASQEPELRSRMQIFLREMEGARAELAAAVAEQERLVVRAPFAGTVVELAEPLSAGEWVKPGELLGVVADMSSSRIDAYVDEADLGRIIPGAVAAFLPADIASQRVDARVISVERTAIRTLVDPELASVHGGAIATRPGPGEALVPERPVYRVTLRPLNAAPVRHTTAGTAVLEGRPASIAGRIWRNVVSVLIRESGF
jgi:putative peptide zinc metalloprotease protein